MTLAVGALAPDFALRDQHGQTVDLASFRNRTPVLMVFYPFAFSGVCSSELGALQESRPRLDVKDVPLLAISCDPVYALRAFADSRGLDFPLLSDFWPHGEVARAFGAFDGERGCATRSSLVVDETGMISWQVHNAIGDARNLEDYRRALAEF